MKKAFTLVELIFVIVIIGILASVAIPKFVSTSKNASLTSVKSIVSSIRTGIENYHGEYIIDNTNDCPYPDLDDADVNTSGEKLFAGAEGYTFFKNPIISGNNGEKDSWVKTNDDEDDNISKYAYYLNKNSYLQFEYNRSAGTFDCTDGSSDWNTSECEKIIDK